MPKKTPSKISIVAKETSDAEQQKLPKKTGEADLKRKKSQPEKSVKSEGSSDQPNKGKQKKTNEIDEIFAALKRRKTDQAKVDKPGHSKDKLKKKNNDKLTKENDPFNTVLKSRRRTNDGFVIYSEEELGINRSDAGQTALCPFDCSCCF